MSKLSKSCPISIRTRAFALHKTPGKERLTHLETGGAAQYASMFATSGDECTFQNVLYENKFL